MPSLNFPEGWIWLKKIDGHVLDPYKLLDPLPFESEIQEAIENGDEEDEGSQEFIANGGAAMIAYGKLQRPDRGGSANPDIELSEISASMGDGNRLPRSRSNEKTPP